MSRSMGETETAQSGALMSKEEDRDKPAFVLDYDDDGVGVGLKQLHSNLTETDSDEGTGNRPASSHLFK